MANQKINREPDSKLTRLVVNQENDMVTELGGLQIFGLWTAPMLFLLMLWLPAPEGLSAAGWHTAAIGLLMAIWWMTEALPIPVTSLLPLVLFPVLGVATIRDAAQPYASPLIFLFMGGFMISMAMQKWHLHVRIALKIIHAVGTRPVAIVGGFMVASAFLSMWVSNTATTMMMLPIGLSVIALAQASQQKEAGGDAHHFAVALMLGIAYACSIGGMGTLIGTPTNVVLAGFLSETYGYDLSFAQWLLVGLPLVIIGLPVAHFILTRLVFPIRMRTLPGGAEFIRDELRRLGPWSRGEKLVASVFALVALLWITRPLLGKIIPGLSDAGIAIFGAVLLFVLPVNFKTGQFVLDWRTAEKLPWGVLTLFGGGLSLAAAVQRTGLAHWIGGHLGALQHFPIIVLVLMTTIMIILLTELTSNTATAAAFLPIVASVAVGMHQNPLLLGIPAVLAASCAFMLPVATPPNAIVYSSGVISIKQMARAGAVLNLTFALIFTFIGYFLIKWAFHIRLGELPAWVTP